MIVVRQEMASDYWKGIERRHAKRMPHGKRILRGGDFSVSEPDGESPTEVWDAKGRKSMAVLSGRGMFLEREKLYSEFTGERNFHMVLHEFNRPGDFVLCRAERYAHLVWCEGKLELLKELGVGNATAD